MISLMPDFRSPVLHFALSSLHFALWHPEYPFWRLQNDEPWELTNAEGLATRRGNTDANKSELLEHNVEGGFLPEVQQELVRNKPCPPHLHS